MKAKVIRIYIFRSLLSLLILGLLLVIAFYMGYLRANYPSYGRFPIQGIDVSHYQGKIDWKALDKKQVRFAFIKATEGGDFKDKYFLENWSAAKSEGIAVGAYHFFTFCKSGAIQAQNFIASVPKETKVLAPVIDLEYGGNCKLKKSKTEVLLEIDTLIALLTAHYEKSPILYVTNAFYQDFDIGKYKDCPIWIRDIYKEPKLPDARKASFWQFSNRGRLQGIDAFVDLNVFYGTEAEFKQLLE